MKGKYDRSMAIAMFKKDTGYTVLLNDLTDCAFGLGAIEEMEKLVADDIAVKNKDGDFVLTPAGIDLKIAIISLDQKNTL